ncbi:hypothetical protein BDDG_12189, partial [Blastomyces dermatitidis ATCC 18188]
LTTSISQLCDLSLIQLAFHVHSYKETFTILHHSFTNFSHSSIIFFIIIIIEYHYLIQDFYFFFCLTLFICSSITLYVFLTMTSHSHIKYYCSAYTEQFVSKLSYIDRSVSVNDSEFNVELLIKNLKNVIMKKLSVLCMIRSSVSLSSLSVSFSVTFSQSSTSASVSGSLTSATSVSVTLTSVTSGFAVSAFVISSSQFKEMLCRLNELCLSAYILSLFLLTLRIIYYICVFRNRNTDVILFYTHECEAFALMSEIILIKDDNTAETTLSHFQASSVTFSPFSVGKIVRTLS